ncbi:MAG: ATP-binding cassette domain-containing protein [Planctomycetes bacterium]|nr:ATP-binding cassette domain-containing protein [Planctomycetota bacterium]
MIAIEELTVAFRDKAVLDRVSLTVPDGEFLCLLGQSGCGKSTLLRALAGLLAPTTGRVTIDGRPVTGPEKACAVVFQDYSLFPWMTTGKNLTLALAAAYPGKSAAEVRALAESYLEMVGLGGVFDQFPGALSGGMRQRAAIARALAVPSRVLLMDEPFGALDPVNRALLQDLVRDLHRDARGERTVVFVTHDVDEALYLGTRVAVLGSSPGRLLALEDNAAAQRLPREALFRDEGVAARQRRIMAAYRRDMAARLDDRALFRAGNGI